MTRGMWLLVALVVVAPGCNKQNNLVFTDANNYTYAGELAIDEIEIPVATDVTIDWSAMTTDIRGRAVTEVDQLSILNFDGTIEEVVTLAERNELAQDSANQTYLWVNDGGATQTNLAAFDITGLLIDLGYFQEDPSTTWLLSMLNVPGGRIDILSSKIIVPKAAATNTAVAFTDGCATLDVTVDLSGPPLETAEGKSPYSFDWTDVTKDVFGHTFDSLLADELIIGHFNTTDLAEVEALFLRLDTDADELYRLNVFGVTEETNLDKAVDADGKAFAGFTAEGTWLVGVACSTCSTPVPLILSVVQVD